MRWVCPRATVNSYLADAREKGIVNISLEPARLASLTIAQELKRHFGLADCLVVPSDDNARPLIDRLGVAGAHALQKLLKSGDTLAVAWGRTILSVGEHTDIGALQDMTVIQATGGTTASFAYTPELTASAVAKSISARCVNITAPAIVASAQMQRMLLDEPLLKEQFATLSRANRIIFGISSLRPNSTIHTSGFFESVPLQHYLAKGAAGVVAGRFIDERGKPVTGPLDDRTIGISLDMLRGIGTRIAVAGGFDKVPALLAALRGGYANVLITDAATGSGILRADGVTSLDSRLSQRQKPVSTPSSYRTHVKKFLNNPNDVVEEMLDGVVKAHDKYPANRSKVRTGRWLRATDRARARLAWSSVAAPATSHASSAMSARAWPTLSPSATSFRRRRLIPSFNARSLPPVAKACCLSTAITPAT